MNLEDYKPWTLNRNKKSYLHLNDAIPDILRFISCIDLAGDTFSIDLSHESVDVRIQLYADNNDMITFTIRRQRITNIIEECFSYHDLTEAKLIDLMQRGLHAYIQYAKNSIAITQSEYDLIGVKV